MREGLGPLLNYDNFIYIALLKTYKIHTIQSENGNQTIYPKKKKSSDEES